MRQFLKSIVEGGLLSLLLALPVLAETKTPYEAAMNRAYARILEARAQGLSIVHTATEIYPEGDKLCVTDFRLVAKKTVKVTAKECFTVKGSFEKRKAGFTRAKIGGVRQYVLSYRKCGEWEQLVTDVLDREDIFPELQHLVVHDALVREYVLRVIVGHSALFYDPTTKGLGQC